MKSIPGTICVHFFDHVADSAVTDYLNSLNLAGVRNSNILNRYSVEVPGGDEEKYMDIFMENTKLVKRVSSSFITGRKRSFTKD